MSDSPDDFGPKAQHYTSLYHPSSSLASGLPPRLQSVLQSSSSSAAVHPPSTSPASPSRSSLQTHELNDAYNAVMRGTLSTQTHAPFYHRLPNDLASSSNTASHLPRASTTTADLNSRPHFTDPQVVISMSKDILATTSKNDRMQVSGTRGVSCRPKPITTLT